jgi:AraC-like DNA-binding protein
MLQIILGIGVAQCAYLFILIIVKRNITYSEKVILAWLIVLCFHLSVPLITRFNLIGDSNWLRIFNTGISFCQAGFLFLYMHTTSFKLKYLLHFLPFLLFLTYYSLGVQLISVEWALNIFLLLSLPAYSIYILVKDFYRIGFRLFPRRKGDNVNLKGYMLVGILIVWVSFCAVLAFRNGSISPSLVPIYSALTILVYVFTFVEIGKRYFNSHTGARYRTTALSDQQVAAIYEKLLKHFESNKPYLNPELTLGQLSEQLGIKLNQLSQVINVKEGKNFNDFINNYRIGEFLRLAQPSDIENTQILAKAYQSGFNSKATFYRAFLKVKGISPSEYLLKVR